MPDWPSTMRPSEELRSALISSVRPLNWSKAARPDWRSIDLSKLEAVLEIDGEEIVRKSGGHASGDPLLPAVDFANDRRRQGGLPAGVIVTTGTYTGLTRAKPGQRVTARFTGFGAAEVLFEA